MVGENRLRALYWCSFSFLGGQISSKSIFTMSSHNDDKKVFCDGGDGASKHPLVYLKKNEKGEAVCPYCGKHFHENKAVKKHD
jgi:uncharacterized Zn-finger protein